MQVLWMTETNKEPNLAPAHIWFIHERGEQGTFRSGISSKQCLTVLASGMCRLVRDPGLVEEGGRVYNDQSPLRKRIKVTEQSFPSSYCSHFLFGSTKIQLIDITMDNSDGAVGYIFGMFQKILAE